MSGYWFPYHYRDQKGWHTAGLPLTSVSDESAKHLDAFLTQMILHENDPEYGGLVSTTKKLLEPDPKFVMGNVVKYSYEIFGVSPRKTTKLVSEINEFVKESQSFPISNWEKLHLKALINLTEEKWMTCADIYEDIIKEYPQDSHALQMLFGIYLFTGLSERLRDVHLFAAQKNPKDSKFYGNIHGKLCFGYEECGQYVAAEAAGQLALDHTPNDIWSMHSMVHIREETLRPNAGLEFMERTLANWEPRASLTQHMWWHKALFNVALKNHETALTLYDEKILLGSKKDNNTFHLSDATSLLMRLQLEEQELPSSVSLKDRWRELALLYKDHIENSDSVLFYDFHTIISCLYGEQFDWADRTRELVIESGLERTGFNPSINKELGTPLFDALRAYASADYETTVSLLKPIRYDLANKLGGSHAQKDILNQILVWAAIRSKNVHLSELLLQERIARTTLLVPDNQNQLNERMAQAIAMI